METRANYVLIGAFSLAGFLGILLFLMWFAKIELDRQFAYYNVYFPEVSGLSLASDVRFAGLSVGKVVDMQLSEKGDGRVRVMLEVREDTPVRTDSTASLEPQGVTGTYVVAITAGRPDSPLLRSQPSEGLPEITAARSVLQTISDQGPEMIDRLNVITEQLAELLGDENRTRVHNILTHTEAFTADLDGALDDVSRATDSIAAAAADIADFGSRLQSLGEAAERTLGNADTALAAFTDSAKKADGLIESGTSAVDEIRAYVADDLRAATQQLGRTAQRLEDSMDDVDLTLAEGRDTLAEGREALSSARRAFDSAEAVISTDIAPVATDLRRTLGNLDEAIGKVADDLPQITERLRNAADSADRAFTALQTTVEGLRAPVQSFARDGLPQFTRVAGDIRGLVDNLNQLVTTLRRNPSQLLSGPKAPEFRR